MKKCFLIAYDYGMGGVWAMMRARSADEITARYPTVVVVERRPDWMTEAYYARLVDEAYDIDVAPTGWLLAAVHEEQAR